MLLKNVKPVFADIAEFFVVLCTHYKRYNYDTITLP